MHVSVRGTPVAFSALMVVALLLGLGGVGYGGYDYVQQSSAVENAVAVETTVVDTEIRESGGRRGLVYRVSVEHTYRYGGTEYTSEQVFPGRISPMFTARTDAETAIEPYEPNTTATAYVDPDSPGRAFLERETTLAPFRWVGLGGLVAVLVTLHAVGPRTPGQETTLRPEHEREPTRHETLFGLDRDTVNRLSKRGVVVAPVVLVLSLVATVLLAAGADSSSVQAGVTDPVGLTLIVALVAALALIGALLLYAVWSFTEYRRLRERIPEPRPPSPFRHPTRLVTILVTNDDLDPYGRRVKLTGFTFVVTTFLVGVFLQIVVL
jgi:hypothetical protein